MIRISNATSHRNGNKRRAAPLLILAALASILAGTAAAQIPPNPIDPNQGEETLLRIVNQQALNDIQTALDNFPVPYVVIASAAGAEETRVNKKAGSPIRVDADRNRDTGQGGNDIQVEVNTELSPVPHLVLSINRIGGPPYAEDLSVVIAFPFDAFNDETLPAPPNLFIGYETTAPYDALQQIYPPGGNAPESVEIRFLPYGALAGTDHDFEIDVHTLGPDNPLMWIAGHFDGDVDTGIQNALAVTTHMDPVPTEVNVGLNVGNTPLFQPTFQTSLLLDWEASEPSKVTFAYLENEGFPFDDPHFDSTLTFDRMPTSEQLSLELDTNTATARLQHDADAVIDSIALRHMRADKLTILGLATDVPTMLDLTVDLTGSVALDVNANTLDLRLELIEEPDGFPGTDDFLGYDLGYVALGVENAPDLIAGYFPSTNSIKVQATNPAECAGCESIDLVELVLDDDAHYDPIPNLVGLDLSSSWVDNPTHHIFSIVDDGVQGTAAARLVDVSKAEYDLDPGLTIAERYMVQLTEPAPMQAYLRTTPGSNLIPNRDVEATCDIDVFPAGMFDFGIEFPFSLNYCNDQEQGLDSLHCFGHIDTLNFDILGGQLPPCLEFEFHPESDVLVKAQRDETTANSAEVGLLSVRLWDVVGPGIPGGDSLFDTPLRDARFRADAVPSLQGSWLNDGAGNTQVVYDAGVPTDATLFLGGAQFRVQTTTPSVALGAVTPTTAHYVELIDEGAGLAKSMSAGLFGVSHMSYQETGMPRHAALSYRANQDRTLQVHVDSGFGGRYFPDHDLDAYLSLVDVPASFDFGTDLVTGFTYTASDDIDSLGLIADLDTTDDNVDDRTHVDFLIQGLPSSAALDIFAGGLTFTMSQPIDFIDLVVTGERGILGEDYRQIDLHIDHIPANWAANWTADGAAVTAVGDQVQEISLIVSTQPADLNATLREPFTTGGGAVDYSAFTREIDRKWSNVGDGGAGREPFFMTRFDDIFGSTQNLGASEDRVLFREGDVNLPRQDAVGTGNGSTARFTGMLGSLPNAGSVVVTADVVVGTDDGAGNIVGGGITVGTIDYTTGAYDITYDAAPAGGVAIVADYAVAVEVCYYELQLQDLRALALSLPPQAANVHLEVPFDNGGPHPIYIGLGEDDEFQTVQVANLPDVINLNADLNARTIHYDSNESAGRIDYYCGPLPSANRSAEVTKAILVSTPTQVDLAWTLGLPNGSASFVSDSRIEARFLTQDGSARTVAVVSFQDLFLNYGVDILDGFTTDECWDPNPFDPLNPELCNAYYEFIEVSAGLTAPQGIDGMLLTYDLDGAEQANGIPPAGDEFLPAISFLYEDVTSISGSAKARLCLAVPPPVGAPPCVPGLITLPVSLSYTGNANLDFWDNGDPSEILGDPDYVGNNPWNLLPPLYSPGNRINPFD